MRTPATICLLFFLLAFSHRVMGQVAPGHGFDFYGDSIRFESAPGAQAGFTGPLSPESVDAFFGRIGEATNQPVVDAITAYKDSQHPDDWVYYQLIRRTAGAICPKARNYYGYTLYKCYLLGKSGYDVALRIVGNKLLLYVRSDADIYDIPSFKREGKQYICLNYHDYGYNIDFGRSSPVCIFPTIPEAVGSFSYAVNKLPAFPSATYRERKLSFSYGGKRYRLRVKLNDEVKTMFSNYPVSEYAQHFNQPLSSETYSTLIPQLREQMAGMRMEQGIGFLMHFTRYAFAYAPDGEHFGREKRLSPEQTLLYESSDCEDRAALFYCLVKELYNAPMLVITFPEHVAVAVKLDKPLGKQIVHNGVSYSVCEPTPQGADLPVGALSPGLEAVPYEVAYAYEPVGK